MALFSSLNAQTGHDVRSNRLRHKKSTTPNLMFQAAPFKWDTFQDVVLLQNRKFHQLGSNLVSTCSPRPN